VPALATSATTATFGWAGANSPRSHAPIGVSAFDKYGSRPWRRGWKAGAGKRCRVGGYRALWACRRSCAAWGPPEPRRQIARSGEGAPIVDRGTQCGRDLRPDAGQRDQPPRSFVLSRHLYELTVKRADALIDARPLGADLDDECGYARRAAPRGRPGNAVIAISSVRRPSGKTLPRSSRIAGSWLMIRGDLTVAELVAKHRIHRKRGLGAALPVRP
jgi:hypothetical protein